MTDASVVGVASTLSSMEALAQDYERRSRELRATMAKMTRPGEQVTKRELESQARRYDAAVFRLRDAVRAVRVTP